MIHEWVRSAIHHFLALKLPPPPCAGLDSGYKYIISVCVGYIYIYILHVIDIYIYIISVCVGNCVKPQISRVINSNCQSLRPIKIFNPKDFRGKRGYIYIYIFL